LQFLKRHARQAKFGDGGGDRAVVFVLGVVRGIAHVGDFNGRRQHRLVFGGLGGVGFFGHGWTLGMKSPWALSGEIRPPGSRRWIFGAGLESAQRREPGKRWDLRRTTRRRDGQARPNSVVTAMTMTMAARNGSSLVARQNFADRL